VLFDRYSYDAAVDPARYRFPESLRGFLACMSRLTPKPDITLVLDAPPYVALSRKQEIEYADAARLRAGYLALALGDTRFRLLDAAQPASEVVLGAANHLIELLADRFRRREKLWLAAAQAAKPDVGTGRAKGWSEALRRLVRGHRVSSSGSTLGYLAVPRSADPRLLIPLDAPGALHASIDAYAPWVLRARIAKFLLHAASWAGVAHAAADEVHLDESHLRDVRELVREVTGEADAVFALLMGTPGRRSNLTLKAMRRDGGVLGFLKVPVTAEAVARVRHEATVLRILGRNEALSERVPKVLFAGEWGDGHLLFQSAAPGNPGPTRFAEPHQEFLRTLAAASGASRKAEEVVEETAAEWEQGLASATDAGWRGLARFTLEEASANLAGRAVECAIMHGDFTPWNTRISAGRLFVFDWEAAEWEAPTCWDRFHFEVQVLSRLRRGGTPPRDSAVERAIRRPELRSLLALYLLRSAAGLVRDGVAPSSRSFVVRKKLLLRLVGQTGRK